MEKYIAFGLRAWHFTAHPGCESRLRRALGPAEALLCMVVLLLPADSVRGRAPLRELALYIGFRILGFHGLSP